MTEFPKPLIKIFTRWIALVISWRRLLSEWSVRAIVGM
jgi:hypothetical protein